MSLFEIVQDQAWAIHPAKLDEIEAFITSRLAGEKFDFDPGPEAATQSGNKTNDRYEIQDGIARIPVMGTLMKRANLFTRYSGGTSYQILQRDISQALDDTNVRGIVLDVDSPGGAVDGVFELVNYMRGVRGRKPIVTSSDGMLTSAAYLLASATDAILVGTATAAGSIGVALTHFDRSEQDRERGIKRTEIYAGKYKRMGTDAEPLGDEAKAYLQERVDYLYGLFLNSVSHNRGIDIDKALAMADGRIFIGSQALDVGLVDSMGTINDAFAMARDNSRKIYSTKGWIVMKIEELKAQHPDLYGQVFKLGADSVPLAAEIAKAKTEGEQAGATAERTRVTEIMGAEGDAEVTRKAITEGLTAEASFKLFFQAEKTGREKALADMQTSLSDSAGHGAKNKDKPGDAAKGSEFMAEVDKYQAAKGCKRSEALRAVTKSNPDLHEAYLLAQQKKGE